MKKIKTAIVTTLCNAEKTIMSFVHYHLSIGFDHIFLFFDKPEDTSIVEVENNKNVTVVKNDWELHIQWSKTKLYKTLPNKHSFINKEVMARQLLNVAVAIEYCKKQKIDWLLHIDCDELFYTPDISVKKHFKILKQKKVATILYSNYEAVPECEDIENCFKEVTLFKRNRYHLNHEQNIIKNKYSIHANPPENRTKPIADFIAYEVGKSAGQPNDRLFSMNVFYFYQFPGMGGVRFPYSKYYLYRLLRNILKNKKKNKFSDNNKKKERKLFIDPLKVNKDIFPCILHYPSCGFDAFWQKYKTLGSFDDKWFDNEKADIKSAIPFHIEARDVVMKDNKDIARTFYKKNVVINSPELIDEFLEKGIFCRITEPAELLK